MVYMVFPMVSYGFPMVSKKKHWLVGVAVGCAPRTIGDDLLRSKESYVGEPGRGNLQCKCILYIIYSYLFMYIMYIYVFIYVFI